VPNPDYPIFLRFIVLIIFSVQPTSFMWSAEMHQDVCWLGPSVLFPLTCRETEITSHIWRLCYSQSIKRISKKYILEICKKCVTPHQHSILHLWHEQPTGTAPCVGLQLCSVRLFTRGKCSVHVRKSTQKCIIKWEH